MDEDAMFTANHVTTTPDIIHAIQILVQKYANQVMENAKKTMLVFAKGYSKRYQEHNFMTSLPTLARNISGCIRSPLT